MMPLFKKAIYRWAAYIKMNTGATIFQFENAPNGEFTVIVGGEWGTIRKFFSRQMVWGTSAKKLPASKRMVRRTCDFARDIIAEVQQAKADAVREQK
jgi:hypothetical protein